MMQIAVVLTLCFTGSFASLAPSQSRKPEVAQHLEFLVKNKGTTCMWLCIGLLVGCCCFGGAAHSMAGQACAGFFNCVLPIGIIIYVFFMTPTWDKFTAGAPMNGWCG